MKNVRLVMVLGWVGFLTHFIFGIMMFGLPELTTTYGNLTFPAGGFTPLFARTLAVTLLPLSLAYLLAALDPAASRSLLIVATSWKLLFVLGELAAIFSGMVTSYIYGGMIMDGILAVVGIYLVVTMSKPPMIDLQSPV